MNVKFRFNLYGTFSDIEITGPPTCGKTTLAKMIAKSLGEFVELRKTNLTEPFGLSLVNHSTKAVIIDEVFIEARYRKFFLGQDYLYVNRPGLPMEQIERPVFIWVAEKIMK